MDFGPRPLHATRKRLIIENVVEDQSGEPVLDVKDKRISFRHEPSFSCLICAGGIFSSKRCMFFANFHKLPKIGWITSSLVFNAGNNN